MTALFAKPKPVTLPPPPPPPPTIDEAAQREEYTRKAARRRGRRAHIFSRPSETAAPGVASRTLLGA